MRDRFRSPNEQSRSRLRQLLTLRWTSFHPAIPARCIRLACQLRCIKRVSRLEIRHGLISVCVVRALVVKSFGPTNVLKGFNLSSAPGEVHAFLGCSGAGKSTLIKIISGRHERDGGMLEFDD
ncbi:ATP-binding cassette domain-containing protein [Burkholderia contaminans]|uniref:ATP-binding cassette domain-containing protein n=1 Tax=Burkholderia contaminans TaxID=488447 RepID=A0A3N8PTS9_9BURK|nr:ATP-binding cassette domain-containing protein [Burkholderia contaminans]RQT14918.1 ATP-binding cassette domain-containing protein [Burkholderia contaminans]